MTPTPQEMPARDDESELCSSRDRIVISGMSGLYPDSRHVKDLAEKLYNKENPIKLTTRWKHSNPEASQYTGTIPNLDRFDAQFFKVFYRLAVSMDPLSRKMLEQVYQAIYDSGTNLHTLNGKKIAVFIGACYSETEKQSCYAMTMKTGHGITGCSKAMFANRVSYWLNAKGPSVTVDNSCASSLVALQLAYEAIKRGDCEAAIVAGTSLTLHPQPSVHFSRMMQMSMDGKTRSFDENAAGCCRTEAINVLFVQKSQDAKRIYAEVVHVTNEFNELTPGATGPKYGFYRSPDRLVEFMEQFYKKAGVLPKDVDYVEAFGSAIPEVDKLELDALDRVFCEGKEKPLLVGSVMSNIGYSEAACGISAITKVLLGYERRQLAANFDCEQPRRDVAALREGRMRIVNEHQPFGGAYAAVNALSYGGVNGHVLLRGLQKPKIPTRYQSSIPYLVPISGRMETAVQNVVNDLKSRPIDPEEIALFHNLHSLSISGHLGRGYIILDTNDEGKTVGLFEEVTYSDHARRPLWFVYSGMGSQWAGMGEQLMRIPVFSAAIERCHKALEPKGVDIVNIITSPEKTIFDNILYSFVGIAAIQIGLTDVLTSVGIVPDTIIGHSVGELGCAYADGCFTAEEMILSAYSRGLVSVQTPFIKGSMAAVGIGFEQISQLVPPEIEVACHNGPESCTISGPVDKMRDFVAQLTEQKIFAKEVPCSNIAFHSRYIAEAGPGLLKYLKEVIKNSKPRTKRWLSTSVPQDQWNEPLAQTSSAEYHTNNLLSPVLFEETARLVPADAVLVEVAPHGLLQAILKRSLPASCCHVPLTRRGHPDSHTLLLDAVGKLYIEGYNAKVEELYPKVEFPVSSGTPMLSHLVEWAHDEKWSLPLYKGNLFKEAAIGDFSITVHDDEHKFLEGNVIKGKTIYPFSAALVAVWDTLSMSMEKSRKEIAVEFSDVHFYSQPYLHERRYLNLNVTIHRGTGSFEVMDQYVKIATGIVYETLDQKLVHQKLQPNEDMDLDSESIYQLLYEKDMAYQGEFRSLHKANSKFTNAEIVWDNNWVTLLDGMLQLNMLRQPRAGASQLHNIRRLNINVKDHGNLVVNDGDKSVIPAELSELENLMRCGGIIIEDVKWKTQIELKDDDLALKAVTFVPRIQVNAEDSEVLQTFLQIIAENVTKETINVLGVMSNDSETTVLNKIKNIMDTVPDVKIDYQQIEKEKLSLVPDNGLANIDLILVHDLISKDSLCQQLHRTLSPDTFLVNAGQVVADRVRPSALYRVVCTATADLVKLELLRWRPSPRPPTAAVVTVRVPADLPLLEATRASLPGTHRLVVLSSYPPVLGLIETVKQWRREIDRNQIFVVMVSEKDSLDELPQLDLAFNVLNNGVWGGDYYTDLEEKAAANGVMALSCGHPGDLDSLQWVTVPEPKYDGIAVNVHYAAINDIDVKRATGVIKIQDENECLFGMDFSGVTDAGERVMGAVRGGAVRSRVVARGELLWPVPEHWSLEDAATVPSAYLLAYYCLIIKAEVIEGNRILIHGGAGALGQAVISIALSIGCEIFTTVSDSRKKKFLMRLFPKLQEDHIGNSRDISFGDMVRQLTCGEGCNVVISCLRGSLKNVSLHSVGPYSLLIDLVQIPNQEAFYYGMSNLTLCRNYTALDLSAIFNDGNLNLQIRLQSMVSSGIARGLVRPLTRAVFSPCDTARAFRLLAASRHRGRALLHLQQPLPPSQPRLRCAGDAWQVLVCHGDAFALALAERLVARGARRLLLHRGAEAPLPALRFKLNLWKELGVNVVTSSEDLTTDKGALNLLTDVSGLGPVEGIYVIANVTSNAAGNKVEEEISYLDKASRKLCPSIKTFFVVNGGKVAGLKTCLKRVEDGMPGKVLSHLAIINATKGTSVSLRSTVRVAERALAASPLALVAHAPPRSPRRLLRQLAKIAGISIPEGADASSTLSELGIFVEVVPAISAFLNDVHGLNIDEAVIPRLTIQEIQNFDDKVLGSELKAVSGLGTFFQYIEPDELSATVEIMSKPTLVTGSNESPGTEIDVSKPHIVIFPGLEDNHMRFGALCERLKLAAVVLHRGVDHPHETLSETANRLVKVIYKRTQVKKKFCLLGYETGVIIALEVASILEQHGLTGTVFLVGGGPVEIQAALTKELASYGTYSELQIATAKHLCSLMTSEEKPEDAADIAEKVAASLNSAVLNDAPWSSLVEGCVRQLLGRVSHSAQYAQLLIETVPAQIERARTYKMQLPTLQSQLVVIHTAGTPERASDLQRFSAQPVLEYNLNTPLGTIFDDLRVGSIVNRHLDSDVLTAFNNTRLCMKYVTDMGNF